MGTTAGVVVTILVNGVAIKTLVFPPPGALEGEGGTEGGEEMPPKQYRVQINVRDGQEKERSVFYGDVLDCLYLAAWVEEESEEGVVSRDVPVQFTLLSGKTWLRLDPLPSSPPTTICSLQRLNPEPVVEGTVLDPPTVQVSTTIDGIPVSATVTFAVSRFQVRLSGEVDADINQGLEP